MCHVIYKKPKLVAMATSLRCRPQGIGNICILSTDHSNPLHNQLPSRYRSHNSQLPQPPRLFYSLFSRTTRGELVPEENFWTLWCKGRLTEADTPTIRLGATPSRLTSAHLHHPQFFTGQMPFLPPNQQCQNTEGN